MRALLIPIALLAAAASPAAAPILDAPDAVDAHSHARPLEARVTHVALDLKADFAAKRMDGSATLDVQAAPGVDRIVLDDKGLEIRSVTDGAGHPLAYSVGASDPLLGAPLAVRLGGARRIRIVYRSGPDAPALQWLTPAQTAGKRHPFLFSQGESILNRSWIPTQDSPGIRQTWEARIVVPRGLVAVMSGERLTPRGEPAPGGGRAFRFRMVHPVAPYLIALAAGDIGFRPLGPRTGVYAEPVTLPAAARELSDTERMVSAAEALYGPYRWGRYDVLVLPPSFPFGGMENPTLTFATPTIIAGDKSLIAVIAHELAHSWSGNLVTNATWNDVWLNEGFTTYVEHRIGEVIFGEKEAKMQDVISRKLLQDNMIEYGANNPATKLKVDTAGANPDNGLSDIPYEKGYAFLQTVENAVGREKFDVFLKNYFDAHAFQSITTEDFVKYFNENLIKGDKALADKIKLDEWVYKADIPSNIITPVSEDFNAIDSI